MTPKPAPQVDLFRAEQPPREPFASVPYQPQSIASRVAAEKVSPVFSGNRETCRRAIIAAASRGGITRKQIAAQCFDNQQQYVTGPVNSLIESGDVYQEPKRINNVIQRNGSGEIIPVRVDGSAVLLPVARAKASA